MTIRPEMNGQRTAGAHEGCIKHPYSYRYLHIGSTRSKMTARTAPNVLQ